MKSDIMLKDNSFERKSEIQIICKIFLNVADILTPTNFQSNEAKSNFSKTSFCNCGSLLSCRLKKNQINQI